jgi:HAD superfamily hydrolase (TIGR01509 family)
LGQTSGEDHVIEAVIFDMDGVLAETEEVHRLAFNEAFAKFELDWKWTTSLYRELLKVTGGKERIAHYARGNGVGLDAAFIAKLHQAKTDFYTRLVHSGAVSLRPGIREFISSARQRGLTLAIATTTSMANVEVLLRSALGDGWRELFSVIGAGDMAPRKKPAPDVYVLVLRELGMAPERCVAIEDSRNGLLAAHGAGLPVIAVRSDYCRDDDLDGAAAHLPDCAGLTLELLDRITPPASRS